jgi:hypothetical protein
VTFSEYWKSLVKKNSGLSKLDTKMTLTVEKFRDVLEQAWDTSKSDVIKKDDTQENFIDILMGKLGKGKDK